MTFTSVTFLIFFPIVVLAYFLMPKSVKMIWLLFCSYFFYCCQHQAMVVYLIIATIITYAAGKMVDIKPQKNCENERDESEQTNFGIARKMILAVSIILLIGALSVFKYVDISEMGLFMPIGISFFTFQSLSYIIDVYRGDVAAENNFLKVALYVSFFPAILAGPIQRGAKFMPQLSAEHVFDANGTRDGLFYMLWGYFLKIVISGRLSILTTQVFGGYMNYSGAMLLTAAFFYAFLIYCDFAGYSYIAIGAGKILGFDLGVNFKQPYLATSIADFWRRWHISLSSWFRDYLYIPLGGGRKGKIRKYINVFIVFAVSGIWHGNTINFLIWGLLNGAYQVMGQILNPLKTFLAKVTGLCNYGKILRMLSVFGSFILLTFAWIFFAIPKLSDAIIVIKKIFTQFVFADLLNGTVFTLGLGKMNLLFAIMAIMILIAMDIYCECKDCDVIGILANIKTIPRWIIYYALIIMILMSVNISTTEFIYSQF